MTNRTHIDPAFADLANMDPDLTTALLEQDKTETARARTKPQQAKAKADAGRSKGTYDLPTWVKTAIEEIARTENVSKSNLVTALLSLAITEYLQGSIDFSGQKVPAKSLRWDWVIRIKEVRST